MSNYLGLATVTAAFGQMISEALHAVPDLSAAPELRVGRPPNDPAFVGANLFLYRVTPMAERRNDDLATRDGKGTLQRLPAAALCLDYIISFYGKDQALEPQRLMGSVIALLHAFPLLTPQQIRRVIDGEGAEGYLARSNLDQQPEPVRFSPTTLDSDGLYRVWSLFPSVPYAPSLTYNLSTVMISPELSPVRSLPAMGANFGAVPTMPPVIDSIDPPALVFGSGVSLTLRGRNMSEPLSAVFDTAPVPLTVVRGGFSALVPSDLKAGVNSIQVISGEGDTASRSESAVFLLQPRLADGAVLAQVGDLTVLACILNPPPRYDQSASLTLTPVPGGAQGAPLGFGNPLRFTISDGFAAALDRGELPLGLRARFMALGAAARGEAQVEAIEPGALWRLTDPRSGQVSRMERDRDRIVVHYGLPLDAPLATIAFPLRGVGEGDYLLSVAYGGSPIAASPLRRGLVLTSFIDGQAAALDRGQLPDVLRSAIAEAGIVLSGRVSVARPMAGDGWELVDASSGKRLWLVQSSKGVQAFMLDAPGGTFFGPSIHMDKAIP